MRNVLLAALAAITLIACGPGAPKAGTVIDKRYEEAHTSTWTHTHDTCVSYDKDGWCSAHVYTFHEHEDYDDPDWMVKLEECHYDDSGNRKCRSGWREIHRNDWERLETGDFYGERQD